MLSEGDREGVLQYATTLCNGVAETVSAMSHQLKYKGSDKDKSVDKEKDEDKEKKGTRRRGKEDNGEKDIISYM